MTTRSALPICPTRPAARCLAGWLLLALLSGCGGGARPEGELPQLHPARGKVTRSGKPVAGGLVQFRPAASGTEAPNLIVTSAVGDDGAFDLSTTHALSQRKARGAPAGDYTVTYHPPGESQDVAPVTPPSKVTIAAGPNDLSIRLDGP